MQSIDDGEKDRAQVYDWTNLEKYDKSQRQLARQMRLQLRYKAARDHSSHPNEENCNEDELYLLSTVSESRKRLFQILFNGKELVSNIRVSADTREIERRHDDLVARKVRHERLEDEAASALEKMQEIANKWEGIKSTNDPLDLRSELKEQTDRCIDLIRQKDGLINQLKDELNVGDERFSKDRTDMLQDINILVERIDSQVLSMIESYFSELERIECAIRCTQESMQKKQNTKWRSLYDQQNAQEVENLKLSLNLIDENVRKLSRVHVERGEAYRESKIRLETDLQVLEQELEHIKAVCLINSEKLDYNYQVLKKREDENIIVKNNQKRLLNNLQEEVLSLKKKISVRESKKAEDLSILHKQVCRLHENIIDIEKKTDIFSQANDRKFRQIWDMKTNEGKELLQKILAADRIIKEEILKIGWSPPEKKCLKKEDLASYRAAVALIDEIFGQTVESPVPKSENGSFIADNDTLRGLLVLISNNSEFLVDEKLDTLLKPYREDEQTLVRLDNIFNAINVKNKEQVDILKQMLFAYATCRICDREKPESPLSSFNEETDCPLRCTVGHPLVIPKSCLLIALKDFVVQSQGSRFKNHLDEGVQEIKVAKDRCTISRLLTREDMDSYWESFEQVFSDDDFDLWNALYTGLTKYHDALQERDVLQKKVGDLSQQKEELTSLVNKYFSQ